MNPFKLMVNWKVKGKANGRMAMIFGVLLYNATKPKIFRVQKLTSPLTKWSCAEIQFL